MANVTLDFGHGGKDPGGVGNGLQEKDIVLKVGLEVGKILERHSVKVTYTRKTDKFIELAERANIANRANTDIFVSIHINAHKDTNAKGVETYSHTNSSKGKKLASDIHAELLKDRTLYMSNRGTKTASFAVLRRTKMPAALVELGFITNKDDAKILKSKQDEFAAAIAKGILNNLGIKHTEIKKETKKESVELYRVRKSWADAKSQLGAFSDLQNAINMAARYTEQGYKVFDSTGKQVYPKTVNKPKKANNEFLARVTASVLNIRSGPGTKYKINGTIRNKGTYTIVETNGKWGKLKSGAGWIHLDYTQRI